MWRHERYAMRTQELIDVLVQALDSAEVEVENEVGYDVLYQVGVVQTGRGRLTLQVDRFGDQEQVLNVTPTHHNFRITIEELP